MDKITDCKLYLESKKIEILKEFPKYESLTEEIFLLIFDYLDMDFKGITENKIYRTFLDTLKNIIETAFAENASKHYLRNIFKILNNRKMLDCISSSMKSKSADLQFIMDRFVNFFVYQNSYMSKEYRFNQIVEFIESRI